MRHHCTDTVDKAVWTEEGGAARLQAVLLALVERKARALHAEQARRRARTHPLLLLLTDHRPDEEASIIGSPGEELPVHWCEHELARHKRKKLKLHTPHRELHSPEQLELERRRRRRRRHQHAHAQKPRKHRTLLVSAIDEQAKVIHVLDPDELPRRARYTIMVTACLLLFLCLLLVGVTLRMAPLIDDIGYLRYTRETRRRRLAPHACRPRAAGRHSRGRRRALRPHHVGARRPPRPRPVLATLFPRVRGPGVRRPCHARPLFPLRALGPRAAHGQRRPDGAGAHAALRVVPRGARRAASPAPAPLVSSGVRARPPRPPAHPGAAHQPRPERPQPLPGAVTSAAGPRAATRASRQGGSAAPRRGSRGGVVLRAGAGVGAGGGGDADAQLGAARAQPNGQVLHVLRAAAPSSHSPGERAHDARRPAGGNLKSHPVVGGIALTPRYSPRPRLDRVRPAAAPPEEPPDPQQDPSAPPDPPPAPRPPVNAAPAAPS